MNEPQPSGPSTATDARRVVERARQTRWTGKSFIRDLMLGQFRFDWIHPFPTSIDSPEFTALHARIKDFLAREVDADAIDRSGEYPPGLFDKLWALGAFSMKIPKDYGGLGFTVPEYCRVIQTIGTHDSNVFAVLSGHQSIGVPQPIRLFGTPEQKTRFLTACANGSLSAFALTEPDAGSDPSNVQTTATWNGSAYVLSGTKLWCTNGTIANLLVVVARHPNSRSLSAFVVDTSSPGVVVDQRCRFMGLRALPNAVIRFDNVIVPRENLIGEEGQGLKIALSTLTVGRLTLPYVAAGIARRCLTIAQAWAESRVQWGVPIARHEAIAHQISDIRTKAVAMDAVATLVGELAERPEYDIRLEAAAAKEWNCAREWEIVDATLQIRGGRGYETDSSLAERGDTGAGAGVERMFRDTRIHRIFEGSSEIMHLFMAREALDPHLAVAGTLVDATRPWSERLATLPQALGFYARWYPGLWLRGLATPFRYADAGAFAPHLRFIERRSRKLARHIFRGMVVFGLGLERKQQFLARCVDIAMELFAMSATISKTLADSRAGAPEGETTRSADVFCLGARRKVDELFRALWHNDDEAKNRAAAEQGSRNP